MKCEWSAKVVTRAQHFPHTSESKLPSKIYIWWIVGILITSGRMAVEQCLGCVAPCPPSVDAKNLTSGYARSICFVRRASIPHSARLVQLPSISQYYAAPSRRPLTLGLLRGGNDECVSLSAVVSHHLENRKSYLYRIGRGSLVAQIGATNHLMTVHQVRKFSKSIVKRL